jgi:hypothetical protein
MRKLEHAQHAGDPYRAAIDGRLQERQRLAVAQEAIRLRGGGRGLAPVVAAQLLLGVRPVQHERAAADARGFGLDQSQHHLHSDGSVHCGAATLQDIGARLRGKRMRRGDHVLRGAARRAESKKGSERCPSHCC